MAENPLQPLFQTFQKVSDCVRTQFSSLTGQSDHPSPSSQKFDFSFSALLPKISPTKTDTALVQSQDILIKEKPAAPVTKEELGRATWTFLHTLAAQGSYPENPTRQQKKDIKELMAIMSRMYPCKDCADHFKEVLRANPVQAGSHAEFSLWLCHVHNVVNRSLGKLIFPCERVDARWGKLECEQQACDVQGNTTIFRED